MKLHGEQYERKKCDTTLHLVGRDRYFKIWGFMRYDLRLEKTELLVYAVIFSYFKSNGSDFRGSRKYLCDWCGAGRTAVDNALRSLTAKDYIKRKIYVEWGVERVAYEINVERLPRCDMFKDIWDGLDYHKEHKKELEEYASISYQKYLDNAAKETTDVETVRARILEELRQMKAENS